jgi:UDP-N-acetylmuramoyl-tripeptide--D-alanyl-D-alanine ligase
MATPIPANAARLTARGAVEATGGRLVRACNDRDCALGITSDSRAVTPGMAFVALAGDKHDGHDYVAMAIDAGAAIVIVENGRAEDVVRGAAANVIEVHDTLAAWGELARAHLRAWRKLRGDAVVLAITGSAGKTTTKELCAALLRPVNACHATPGNLNNRVGVPAVAFALEPRHRFAVFEVGMSLPGEIAALARIVQPDVAVITNIGVAHAEGVGGSRSDVAREKGDLLAGLSDAAIAVVPHDDEAVASQLARCHARRVVTFGTTEGADYRLVDRGAPDLRGANVRIARGGAVLDVRLPIVGEAAAFDLLAALAATESVTGPSDGGAIGRAIGTHLRPLPGRMQTRHVANGMTVLDDTYNANPTSVRAALRTLAEVAAGRRAMLVLGEMCELGPVAIEEHASLGPAIAASGARIALSCGGLAELAVAAAERAGVFCARATNADAAGRLAAELANAGDVVLVKASRSVGAERVVQALLHAGGGEITAPEDSS